MKYFITEEDILNQTENKLSLFDFDDYIKKNNLKEVKNSNIISLTDRNSFDDEGLWSEIIFGRSGSKERKTRFGYINLNTKMIRPVMYKIIKTYSEPIRNILAETSKYIIGKKGELIENDSGETGLLFLLKNYDKINFADCAKPEKKEIGEYIEQNKNLIFIQNYWIIPPGGLRDISLNKKSQSFSSEINDIYEKIVSLKDQIALYDFDDEMKSIIIHELHNALMQAHIWIQSKMVGKGGILRGSMLKKRTDYSSRIIAGSNCQIPFGSVGMPWHDLYVLYEPFIFHYILKVKPEIQKDIKAALGITHDKPLNAAELKKLTNFVQTNHKNFPDDFRDKLFAAVEYAVKDKDIIVKRDPVVSRGNYFAAQPIPLKNAVATVVNPLNCPPMTLDFDGDQVVSIPVFSKEGLKEVAKMNPAKNKSFWYNISKNGSQNYTLELDTVSTIYAATRDYD